MHAMTEDMQDVVVLGAVIVINDVAHVASGGADRDHDHNYPLAAAELSIKRECNRHCH